jgi:hypothetical protein
MERLISFLQWCSYGFGFLAASLFLVWGCTFVLPLQASQIFQSVHSFVCLPLTMLIPTFFKANPQGGLFLYAVTFSVITFCYNQLIERIQLWMLHAQELKQKKRAFTGPSLIQQMKGYFIDLKRGKLKKNATVGLLNALKQKKEHYYYVLVSFPFQTNRAKGELFFEYHFFEGQELASITDTLLVKFHTLEQALNYATKNSQRLKHTYAQMRPSEVKPVFKIALHRGDDVVDSETLKELFNFCQELCKIASPFQIVSSNDIYLSVTENKKATIPCRLIPLGFYRFDCRPMQEVFEVEPFQAEQSQ